MPQIHFVAHDGSEYDVEVEAGFSIMEGALNNGIEGIAADCGGACSCATCHVYIDPEWFDLLPPITGVEKDMLDCVPELRDTSRLACQVTMTAALDGIKVEIPEEQM